MRESLAPCNMGQGTTNLTPCELSQPVRPRAALGTPVPPIPSHHGKHRALGPQTAWAEGARVSKTTAVGILQKSWGVSGDVSVPDTYRTPRERNSLEYLPFVQFFVKIR